jgi:hypothetical protein
MKDVPLKVVGWPRSNPNMTRQSEKNV